MHHIDNKRVEEIITRFQNKKLLVIGDLMIDEYLWGNVTRLSPEAPVPIVEIKEEAIRFGGAANVALNMKKLGCQPILIGVVGKDRMGESFFKLIQDAEMIPNGIVDSLQRPTTVKTRIIGGNQHLARVDKESRLDIDESTRAAIVEKILAHINEADAVILEDYNKGILTKEIIQFILAEANRRELIITVDPKFINFLEYKNVSVFKPNIKETAQALARVLESDESVFQAGFDLLKLMQAKSVLLTRGSKGLSLFQSSGEVTHIDTKARKVADVSGAGDTVISAMTAGLMGGGSLKESAIMANYAAGIVCEEVGVVPIEKDRLLAQIAKEEA